MESTLLLSFLKAAKFWCWLGDPQSPSIFKEIKFVFDNIYKSNHSYNDPHHDSSTNKANLDISAPQSIPDDLKNMQNINKNKVFIRAHIKLQGILYTCSQTHLGNSLVHFHPDGDWSKPLVPGQIKYIYSTDGGVYAFALQQEISLPSDPLNLLALYLHFPAKTYSSKYSSSLEHIDLNWVFFHYAWWDISPNHSVVLSLTWVSCSLHPSMRCAVLLTQHRIDYFVSYIAESQFTDFNLLVLDISTLHVRMVEIWVSCSSIP